MKDLKQQKNRRSPEDMIRHLKNFNLDLKFSVGVWFLSPAGSRFHDRYGEELPIKKRMEIAARLKDRGLEALEAHYPSEINEENYDLWRSFMRDTGMRFSILVPNLFYDSAFEFGALSSSVPAARQEAIRRTKRTIELAKEFEADLVVVWPGIDGYENPFGLDMVAMRDRFASGLAEAMDSIPGMRLAMEPKPYEPRGHIIYGTTAEGVLLSLKVEDMLRNPVNRQILDTGESLVGLNPEIGHILMGYEEVPYALSLAMEYGKLAHTHWNSQPLGNYDQDLNVGVVSPEQAEAGLYVLKMYGYSGYFGIDINPERMPVERAVINCMDALKAMNDRINSLDHEKIIESTSKPEKNRGYLEALLIRARYPGAKGLSPMPDFEL